MIGLLTKVWRDITGRPARSLMTVLAIAIGVGGIVAIVSTAYNITRAQRVLHHDTKQADITLWVRNAPDSLLPLLEADPRIQDAELRVTHLAKWRLTGRCWRDIELVATDALADARVNQFDKLAGSLPVGGQIMLDVAGATREGVEPGATIVLQDGTGRLRQLEVSGISRSPAYLSASITQVDVGYVPRQFIQRAFDIPGSNQLLIRLADPRKADAVLRYVDRLLRRQHIQSGTPELRKAGQFAGKRELDALILIMYLFGGLGSVLATFLVINTMSATVAEQTNEIGILKALGGSQAQVLVLYLTEALAYGLFGTAVGIVLGTVGGWRFYRWIAVLGNASVPFQISPVGLALGAGVGLFISLLGGYLPARRGARLPVKEALESYGIQGDYGQSVGERLLGRLGLPAIVALAIRDLYRRKGRTILTLGVIALATAAFVAADSSRSTVDDAIDQVYCTYYADAWLWLESAVGTPFERTVTAADGVYAAEAWSMANGVVAFAEARLWGLPAHSTLYREVLAEGRWLYAGELEAVVLSSELANSVNAHLGELVEIQVAERSREFEVVGIAVDNTIYLGSALEGKAFLLRESLNDLVGGGESYRFFALGLASREPDEVDEILARLETKLRPLGPVVQPAYAEIESAQGAARLLVLALLAMLILVALMGSLGMLNTLTLNVIERRREIAVLRAIGATNVALVAIFCTQGLVLGMLGWALGLALGYPAGRLLTAQMESVLFSLRFKLLPRAVIISASAVALIAVLSSLGPALAAAHLRASDGLRYE